MPDSCASRRSIRLQPSFCLAGNSMLSQESHCTKRIAGRGPLVPAGRVRMVRNRLPFGARSTPYRLSTPAISSSGSPSRRGRSPSRVDAAWAANGRQQASAVKLRFMPAGSACQPPKSCQKSADVWPIPKSASFSPDGGSSAGNRLGRSLPELRRGHAYARLEGAVERSNGAIADVERNREHGKARIRGPAQALAGLAYPQRMQEIVEVAMPEPLVDDTAQQLLARLESRGQRSDREALLAVNVAHLDLALERLEHAPLERAQRRRPRDGRLRG